jgi:hypothetical protein
MKPIIFASILLFLFISRPTFSQMGNELNIDSVNAGYKNSPDVLNKLTHTDLSFLWMNTPNRAIVGFIGKNYYRFQIKFTSIKRNGPNATAYVVTGYTRKWDTVRYFTGYIGLEHAWYVQTNPDFGDTIKEGIFTGTYNFMEATNELPCTGQFRGNFMTSWYTDKSGNIHYDDLNSGDDGDYNNSFVGTWKDYSPNRTLICNWGDYRIPNSGNLDEGVGEFAPDSAYVKYGWQNFKGTEYDGSSDGKDTIQAQEKADQWWPNKKQ